MGSIFEHSEDTFWGGVWKEAVSQNEARSYETGVFLVFSCDLRGRRPSWLWAGGLWCVFILMSCWVASAVLGFSPYSRFWGLFLESELSLAGVEYFGRGWGDLKSCLGCWLMKSSGSLPRRSSLVPTLPGPGSWWCKGSHSPTHLPDFPTGHRCACFFLRAQPHCPPDSLLALDSGLSFPFVSAPVSAHVGWLCFPTWVPWDHRGSVPVGFQILLHEKRITAQYTERRTRA